MQLPETLSNFFGTKGADSVQPEAEDYPVFLSNANVESVILCCDRTAIPTVADRDRGTN